MVVNRQRNSNRYYAECACDSSEHLVRFTYDLDDPQDEAIVIMEPQLSNGSFFWRLRRAVRYLFGYKCKYGQWDETLLDPWQVKELRDYLDGFLEHYRFQNFSQELWDRDYQFQDPDQEESDKDGK